MRFLPPELYVQFNSPDDDVASQAQEAFELADEQARQHWERIKSQLPPIVVQFGEGVLMHDAMVFGPAWAAGPNGEGAGEVVIVAHMYGTLDPQYEATLVSLHYHVRDEPGVEVPDPSDVFNRVQPHWLWDEFDLIEPGLFAHSILISDGRVVTIRFHGFRYTVAPLVNPGVFQRLQTQPTAKASA
jgi:hypothetical protein